MLSSIWRSQVAILIYSVLYFLFALYLLYGVNQGRFLTPTLLQQAIYGQSRASSSQPARIAIVMVVVRMGDLAAYDEATSTMRCYAGISGYPLYYLYMDNGPGAKGEVLVNGWNATRAVGHCRAHWGERIDYEALMCFRHCMVRELLTEHEGVYDWVLMLDADIGVVNPQHRIEEWIEDDVDVIFHFRTAYEIMAGSYLAHNTPNARLFLAEWTRELTEVSPALVNHDQSAIQETFMRFYAIEAERNVCREYYLDRSPWGNYPGTYFGSNLFHVYAACTLHFMEPRATDKTADGVLYLGGGNGELPRAKILPRFYPAWERDGDTRQLTSRWAPSDFMFHIWKNEWRGNLWASPLNESFGHHTVPDHCVPERRQEIIDRYWRQRYVPELMVNESELWPDFDRSIREWKSYLALRFDELPNKGNFSA